MKSHNKKTANDLQAALIDLMENKKVYKKYEGGINAQELFNELKNYGYDFPLISVLDVANEMRSYYGEGK